MTWRDYHPEDPDGLRAFIKYQFDEMVKAGYFFCKDEQEADKIYDEVSDRTMAELKEHLAQFNDEVDS